MRKGPGLAKVRAPPLTVRREATFVAALDGALTSWLARADVVSEGGHTPYRGKLVYYGTTSILLTWTAAADLVRVVAPPLTGPALCAVAHDPHLRVRALRIARREAEARAGSELGVVVAEISVEVNERGICLRVEIEAARVRQGKRRTTK
jgi:hypothetical protein